MPNGTMRVHPNGDLSFFGDTLTVYQFTSLRQVVIEFAQRVQLGESVSEEDFEEEVRKAGGSSSLAKTIAAIVFGGAIAINQFTESMNNLASFWGNYVAPHLEESVDSHILEELQKINKALDQAGPRSRRPALPLADEAARAVGEYLIGQKNEPQDEQNKVQQ